MIKYLGVFMMTDAPIGVFDSGLGGLTAVKELLSVLPDENIVYFGDTGRVPYGNRSRETIIKYARQDAAFLMSKNVKFIIAACGTVSSVASELGDCFSVPFTGVVTPTAMSAVKATHNGTIGVIGTTATIKSGSYKRELERINPDIRVLVQDCPLFVPLVENGFVSENDFVVVEIAERYLKNFKKENVDTVILGCTHYPILKNVIKKVMGESVTLIDSGRETALYAAQLLKKEQLLNKSGETGKCSFYVSDRPDGFSKLAGMFLQREIAEAVERIDINRY